MYKIILRKPTLALAMTLGFLGIYSEQAQAICIRNGGAHLTPIETPEVVVPRGATPGTVLHTSSSKPGAGNLLSCAILPSPLSNRHTTFPNGQGLPTPYTGVVTTHLPGIGLKLTYQDKGGEEMGDTAIRPIPIAAFNVTLVRDSVVTYNGETKVDFVLLDGFSGGQFPGSGTFVSFVADNNSGYHSINYGGTRFVSPTCSINIGDLVQTAPLGNVDVNIFTGPGSGSGWYEEINLRSEECDLTKFNTVEMTASSANTDPDNPDLFATTGIGKGVGVELGVVSTGEMIKPGGTVRFPALDTGGVYKLKARYTRTTAPLVLGAANSAITIDINYL